MTEDDLHIAVSRNDEITKRNPPTLHASIVKGRDGRWFWHIAASSDGRQPIKKGFATRDEAVIDAVNQAATWLDGSSQ